MSECGCPDPQDQGAFDLGETTVAVPDPYLADEPVQEYTTELLADDPFALDPEPTSLAEDAPTIVAEPVALPDSDGFTQLTLGGAVDLSGATDDVFGGTMSVGGVLPDAMADEAARSISGVAAVAAFDPATPSLEVIAASIDDAPVVEGAPAAFNVPGAIGIGNLVGGFEPTDGTNPTDWASLPEIRDFYNGVARGATGEPSI
jgi:hypothetical protein